MSSDTEPVPRSPEPPVVRLRTRRPPRVVPPPLEEDGTIEALELRWRDARPTWDRWLLVAIAAAIVVWLGWNATPR